MNQNVLNKKLNEENIAKTKLHEQQHLASPDEIYFAEKKSSLANSSLSDSDDDGMPDTWETDNGLNPNDPFDVWEDPDNDFVLNLFEYQLNSDPFSDATPNIKTVSAGENIEDAIDETPTGSVLRIESGTYNVNYMTFDPKTIMIQGGWNSNFTSRDLAETPTIFDGQSLEEVLYFGSFGVSANIIIDGLTLTQGKGSFGAFNLSLYGSALSNLCIKDCKIINSQSTFDFGGVVNIQHRDSSYSEVFIVNTLIANNSSSGIYNQTTDKGVGNWKIINSNITNNSSLNANECFGIDAFTLDSAALSIEFVNTILWGNQNTDLEISRSIIANAEYSDIGTVNITKGAIYNEVSGNISADPLFVNPAGIEYNLKAGSPCIGTGIYVGLPYAGTAPDMGLIFVLGSQVSDQIVEVHEFGATNTQWFIYPEGITFEFKAQNTMMVETVEAKSVLASPKGTFHIEISIEDSLIAKWEQYVKDLTYKPYVHTKQVSYSLSEGDTIVYKIYGAGSPAGGLLGINSVKLISAYILSNDASIHSTKYGIFGGEEITMVDPTVSVTSFLDGITVHDSANVVMLDSSGGNEVINPDITNVVTGMVVKVTAEDGTTVEYAISTNPTNISANHAESIVVYPNPACDNIIIQTTISGELSIIISSINGKLLYSDKIEESPHQIDLSSFQKGVHIITIRSKDFVATRKIIKL